MVGSIRKFLLSVRITEFILDDRLTRSDETRVGDDAELFDFRGQKDARGRQQKGIDALERIACIEALEVDGGRRDDLLTQFQLFAQNLYEAGEKIEDLLILLFGEDSQVVLAVAN